MTDKDTIEKLKEIGDKATGLEWEVVPGRHYDPYVIIAGQQNSIIAAFSQSLADGAVPIEIEDANFIVEARNNWTWLIQQAELLEEVRDVMESGGKAYKVLDEIHAIINKTKKENENGK